MLPPRGGGWGITASLLHFTLPNTAWYCARYHTWYTVSHLISGNVLDIVPGIVRSIVLAPIKRGGWDITASLLAHTLPKAR